MGRHHATPARRTRTLIGAGLAASALTLAGSTAAYAGDHGDHPDNPDTTTTECGAMEPGDALIAAPVCAPIDVIAPIDDLLDVDALDGADSLLESLGL